MKPITTLEASVIAVLSSFILHPSSFGSDWPQFRGIESTGVSADSRIPSAPKVRWTIDLPGRGLSSPIVVGDKVFITAASGPKQDRLHVFCFNAKDGSKVWERQLQATGRTMTQSKTCVAAPTPCSDGKRIFAIWSCNDVAAFDLAGNLLWLRGLTEDYPNVSNSLGMASSLVFVSDTVIAPVENDSESYTIGLDANTGRTLWKMDRPKAANWSTPVVWHPDAKAAPLAILQSKDGLTAVDPQTGSRLWDYKDGASTVSSSVVSKTTLYAASHGITALEPQSGGKEPKQLWREEQVNPGTASPIVLGGKIYAVNKAGVLVQADATSGEKGWKLRLTPPFSGTPVGSGTQIVAVSEKGLLQIVDTTAAEGAVTATLELPLKDKDLILSTPALSGGNIFVRSDAHLWCIGD